MSDDSLIDAIKLTDARTALICARLHLRGGKRRLQKGLTAPGIAALYDSILFGMHYYIARHKSCASITENTDPWDAVGLFQILAHVGVFDDPLSFNRFSLIVERALWQRSFSSDTSAILVEVEEMLKKLDVLPFKQKIPLKKSRISL
jgi:hypothetical protein